MERLLSTGPTPSSCRTALATPATGPFKHLNLDHSFSINLQNTFACAEGIKRTTKHLLDMIILSGSPT